MCMVQLTICCLCLLKDLLFSFLLNMYLYWDRQMTAKESLLTHSLDQLKALNYTQIQNELILRKHNYALTDVSSSIGTWF
jgi:hypothetical protein